MRWSLRAAAIDWDIDRETLAKRLAAQGIKQGEDDKYATSEINRAVFGDLDGEELLLTREKRIKAERENRIAEKQLIPSELVERVWSATMIEYRQRVLASDCPQTMKEELLEILSEPKIDEYFAAAIKALEASPDEDAEAA